ncbi:MAG: COX15/CtaA family protein [Tumebacillaceae bacterium]
MGYRLPLVTTIVVFMMTILGAVVVGTQAGFACPDWPLCHGQIIPPLDNPLVLIEWFHRTTSALGGLFILLTAFKAWRHRHDHKLYKQLSILTVIVLAVQGLAGAAIVVFKLPGYMTTIDVTNGMFLISIFGIMTALELRRKDLKTGKATKELDGRMATMFRPAQIMFFATLLEVVVGGLFRHTGYSEALFGRNDYLKNHFQDIMLSPTGATAFLMFHIMIAIMVTAALVWVLVQAIRKHVLLAPAIALLLVVLMQMLLGFVTLETELKLVPATSHMADAALIMVLSSFIGARAYFAKTVHALDRVKQKPSDEKQAGHSVVVGTN